MFIVLVHAVTEHNQLSPTRVFDISTVPRVPPPLTWRHGNAFIKKDLISKSGNILVTWF